MYVFLDAKIVVKLNLVYSSIFMFLFVFCLFYFKKWQKYIESHQMPNVWIEYETWIYRHFWVFNNLAGDTIRREGKTSWLHELQLCYKYMHTAFVFHLWCRPSDGSCYQKYVKIIYIAIRISVKKKVHMYVVVYIAGN